MKLPRSSQYLLAAALGLTFSLGTAQAQLNLFNTGVDTTPANGFDDNYYYLGTTATIGVKPAGTGINAVIANQPGYPFTTGNWPVNNATSQWIMPTPTGTLADGLVVANPSPVIFVFTTSFSFDTTVYDLSLSSITFKLMADNEMSVYLNTSLMVATPLDHDVFGFDTQYTLNAPALQSGANVLTFYVTNVVRNPNLNPSGFRIEVYPDLKGLVNDADVIVPVPEPSTYGMIGVGLLMGAVAFRRLRRKTAAAA